MLKTLKKWKCVPCTKKMVEKKKVTTDLSVFFQIFQKFMKGVYMIRSMFFFENKFSRCQCGFRKGFNTQNALLSIVEKMLLARDKKEICGVILTYLSKAFNYISHDLLIANLNAYGLDQNALNVIHHYLFGRSQKTKVGSSFNDLLDILYCELRGFI